MQTKDIVNWLCDPGVIKINRLDAHSDHIFYDSAGSMNADNRTLYKSLNGQWKFKYAKNLNAAPSNFYKEDFDVTAFDDISVPSHIEMQGYDQIHYVNTMYPWDGKTFMRPPQVDMDNNPVLSYVTYFDMPQNFVNKAVCIEFAGVEQAFCVWLNGEFVGYAEDTFTPSHFDLTKYIKPQNNKLCVQVYKRACTAWLEDQDFFRFSGIFRGVTLYAKPAVHIEDLWVQPQVNSDLKSGLLDVKVKVSGTNAPNILLQLFDAQNTLVIEETPAFKFERQNKVDSAENDIEYYTCEPIALSNINLWQAGDAYLYSLVLTVKDENGNATEFIKQPTGFRLFEIKNKVMYLNGERLIINGVNRHEWNPSKGRAIDESDMLADLEVILKNNINAVRTSHYPNQSLWYKLCDEAGLAVMDEANLETHGSWQKMGKLEPSWSVPGDYPMWKDSVIDRAVSMFERDKNHASILWWSCGNEAYTGENILAMANYFRRKDKSRVVHYEGCFWNRDYCHISDVESRMYAHPHEIEEYLTTDGSKPFMLCEYMHNMGNSIGGMESYINLIDKYDSYQGGFIWDYMDQAIYADINGKKVLCYGGDFADRPTDYNFSGNGIVFANRTEKPAMQEVKYWYMPKQQRQKQDEINSALIQESENTFVPRTDKQFEIVRGDINLGVKGDGFEMMFSLVSGGLTSLKYDGYEWIYRAPKPTYHRAPTENDSANGFLQSAALWKAADLYQHHIDVKIDDSIQGQVSITYTFNTLVGTQTFVTYTAYSDGTIKVSANLKGMEGLPDLSQFGMQFATQHKVKNYTYTGFSGETYPDRYKGGKYGTHTCDVSLPDYLVPQECGLHSFSKKFTIAAMGGPQKLHFIAANSNFHFSVLPNSSHELENATHKHELPCHARSFVRVLSHMRGVGGIDSWGADVESAYHISAQSDLILEFYIKR